MFIPPILKIYAQERSRSLAHPSTQFIDVDSVSRQIDTDRIASLFFYRIKELTAAVN